MGDFTLLDDGQPVATAATIAADAVLLTPEAVRAALGWELKPQGLCRGETCIPVRATDRLRHADAIDLAALAAALGRPLALDLGERVAALGASAAERGAQLRSLAAPDFTLPDLDGHLHSLDEQRDRKVLLLAWASW
jgi:hypothetical protein